MARARFASTRAEQWLRERLQDGEPHIAGMLIEAAAQEGIKERTLQLARQNIGATRKFVNKDGVIAWHWQLKHVEVQK